MRLRFWSFRLKGAPSVGIEFGRTRATWYATLSAWWRTFGVETIPADPSPVSRLTPLEFLIGVRDGLNEKIRELGHERSSDSGIPIGEAD